MVNCGPCLDNGAGESAPPSVTLEGDPFPISWGPCPSKHATVPFTLIFMFLVSNVGSRTWQFTLRINAVAPQFQVLHESDIWFP